MAKKIIIIGGGVSGLSAGIYGQKNGFETVVFEKNPWIGGSCSAWKRKEFTIDNCLHWLTGTKDGPTFEMWKELGVLKDDEPLVQRELFFASRSGNQTATLWRNLEKTREEFLKLSPEDSKEINGFLDCVLFINGLFSSGLDVKEIIRYIKERNFSEKPFEFALRFIRYLKMDSQQLSDCFKNPAIKSLFTDFMAKEYESYWLMLAYAFFVSGNGDLPQGGSLGMAKNLKEKYLSLGGQIVCNSPVKEIVISNEKKTLKNIENEIMEGVSQKKIVYRSATGVLFEDGRFETADYVVATCDINYTYQILLNNRYTPASLQLILKKHGKGNPSIYSSFQVAFAVDGLFQCVPDTLGVDCSSIKIGSHICHRFTIKNYRLYGDYIAPKNQTVIQVSIPQYYDDYKYWKKLNESDYKKSKMDTAEIIKEEIEKLFPEYRFKLSVLDVWTPRSYKSRNNDYLGAYMRYITTPFNINAILSMSILGLSNVLLASHYLRYPGGLPTAAQTGHDVIEEIKKLEELKPFSLPFTKK